MKNRIRIRLLLMALVSLTPLHVFSIILHEEYPCLTENETLTCILSALNISVKQIADIQGRSQDAVYKQKYRLKEKLPLDVYELFFPKGNL